jgi:hypothetical protein
LSQERGFSAVEVDIPLHPSRKVTGQFVKSFYKVGFCVILFFVSDFLVYHWLKRGVVEYYGLEKNAQVLCVGDSHMVLDVDAERLERELCVPVAKYAVAGANVVDRLWMIRHALSLNPNVKSVVYDVDARMFDTEGLSSASYSLFLPFADDAVMSPYLKKEATWQEYYTGKFIKTARFRDQTLNIALRGLLNRRENKKKSTVRLEQYRGYLEQEWQRKIRMDDKAVARFKETLDLLSHKGLTVVLVYLPVIDVLNQSEREKHDQVIRAIEEMATSREQVLFLNYNVDYESRHDLFFDPRHLNEKGNQAVTSRLIDDIRKVGI